jgi:hypothetical protein
MSEINVEEKLRRILAAIIQVCQVYAGEAEGYMKNNAPWKDRTGVARANLHSKVIIDKDNIVIRLSHGVEYGVYLEYAHGGKYAILNPTARLYKEKLIRSLNSLFKR